MSRNSRKRSVTESLIAELQNAEVGSRELRDLVIEALGWTPVGRSIHGDESKYVRSRDGHAGEYGYERKDGTTVWRYRPLDPTRSLDDALSMVPDYYAVSMEVSRRTDDGDRLASVELRDTLDEETGWHHGVTPAIAVCIALLRSAE